MKMNRRLWIIMSVVLVVIGVVSHFSFKRQKSQEISYREISLTPSDLEITILSTGVVQPENRLEIKPPIAGRVEEILVKEGQKVRKGQILAWMSSTERAALLDAARTKGAEELKRWEELYRPTPIMAPIDGTIILRKVESGQTFTNVDPVFVMSDRLTIKAQVDETDIAQVRVGQKAKIVLDAYPDVGARGRVDQIAFEATTVNNVTTYVVDVLPEEALSQMRSGMTANVTFLVTSKKGVLSVPNDALRVHDGKYFVLIKGPEGRPSEEKAITVGLSDGRSTEVVQGLSEKDIVLAAEIKPLGTAKTSKNTNPFAPKPPGRVKGSR